MNEFLRQIGNNLPFFLTFFLFKDIIYKKEKGKIYERNRFTVL